MPALLDPPTTETSPDETLDESFGEPLLCAADFPAEQIKWLWPGRIPIGKVTLLVGDPGQGKSLLSLDIASRITRGTPWPDEESTLSSTFRLPPSALSVPPSSGSVLILSAEDQITDTIRPRLDAAGADPTKIFFLTLNDLRHDLPRLRSTLNRIPDCRLVIIDPVNAFVGPSDSHFYSVVRRVFQPLAKLAAEKSLAVLGLSHLRKSEGAAIQRSAGSMGFVSAARSVWTVCDDPAQPGLHLLLPLKNNFSADSTGLAYKIESKSLPPTSLPHQWGEGNAPSTPVIQWQTDIVTTTAVEALAPPPKPRGPEPAELKLATEWLRDQLANGPKDSFVILASGTADGFNDRTLRRALVSLGGRTHKTSFYHGWEWSLPEHMNLDSPAPSPPTPDPSCSSSDPRPLTPAPSQILSPSTETCPLRENSHVPEAETGPLQEKSWLDQLDGWSDGPDPKPLHFYGQRHLFRRLLQSPTRRLTRVKIDPVRQYQYKVIHHRSRHTPCAVTADSEPPLEAKVLATNESYSAPTETNFPQSGKLCVLNGPVVNHSPNRTYMSDPSTSSDPRPLAPAPFADLPAQYDHAAAQAKWYPYWESQGYFHAEADDPRPPYCVVIPPPNVTGALHLGHALNNTLQDILCRMKRMQGYNVLWMPGTDHAGIATQAVVERRLFEEEKLTRHDLGREKLVERIWEWKNQYEQRILSQLKQLGASCDWQRLRFTLDDQCARAVRETFFKLFADNKIYRGKRLVNWDTFLQTAVSDDEVFHEPTKGHFWHFNYPVIDPKPGEPTHVTIATTRPETMLGDTAVAVHPDPAKALDKAEQELRERIANSPEKDRPSLAVSLEELIARRKDKLPQLEKLRDMAKRGVQLELPLTGRKIPLIADEWAKPELGSGCVKITPAHDENDYQVWQRNQSIGAINIMNTDGTLNDSVPEKYRGLTMKKAREVVVADMEAAELCVEIEDREIDLAHSDRSKTPIEPYLADQWFVKMGAQRHTQSRDMEIPVGYVKIGEQPDGSIDVETSGLAQFAIDAVVDGRVKIIPERYKKTYVDWLSEKRDWPVGRQLWWGHRIPVWTRRFSNKKERDVVAEEARQVFELDRENDEQRSYFYHHWDPETIAGIAYFCLRTDDPEIVKCVEAQGYVQEDEVLDTWFSSALWPHSTLGWPDQTPELAHFYPTSTLITSRDIITLWVARMVLAGLYNMNEIPFHEVFIHPKILDGFGETMSKSKGNGVDPLDVIDKFGADSLRFGIAYLSTETQDVRLPVDFECPHCHSLVTQTKKNRTLPRVECDKCKQPFGTQWSQSHGTEDDKKLPRGAAVSEKFELGRNFCNKLWNASRFALMNLSEPGRPDPDQLELLLEDRWLLSRLATVTDEVTRALAEYRFADAARTLYGFAWDEFCSFYVEMTKARFAVPEQRGTAQQVLAHALDTLLRLLHPMTPFLTEEVWQLLNQAAPNRGLTSPARPSESICIAPWPEADVKWIDKTIEAQFAKFQTVMGAVRNIRQEKNIPPREPIQFSVRCDDETVKLLKPMEPYFASMAGATATAWGPKVTPPARMASKPIEGMEVHVDISAFFDEKAERTRLEKEREQLAKFVDSLNAKLSNENFVSRAPANVVEEQRNKLSEVREQLESVEAALAKLA
jgi:valyl-tRNA synthetase